jgi:predicted RNA-binding protein with PUA domain
VGQIVAIFHKDRGLMVEIAEDAIDHRQRISDSDLTDEVIFAGSGQKSRGFTLGNIKKHSPLNRKGGRALSKRRGCSLIGEIQLVEPDRVGRLRVVPVLLIIN